MNQHLTDEVRENLGNINEIESFEELEAKTKELAEKRELDKKRYMSSNSLSNEEKEQLAQQIFNDGKVLTYFYSLLEDKEDIMSYLRVKKLGGILEAAAGDEPSSFEINQAMLEKFGKIPNRLQIDLSRQFNELLSDMYVLNDEEKYVPREDFSKVAENSEPAESELDIIRRELDKYRKDEVELKQILDEMTVKLNGSMDEDDWTKLRETHGTYSRICEQIEKLEEKENFYVALENSKKDIPDAEPVVLQSEDLDKKSGSVEESTSVQPEEPAVQPEKTRSISKLQEIMNNIVGNRSKGSSDTKKEESSSSDFDYDQYLAETKKSEDLGVTGVDPINNTDGIESEIASEAREFDPMVDTDILNPFFDVNSGAPVNPAAVSAKSKPEPEPEPAQPEPTQPEPVQQKPKEVNPGLTMLMDILSKDENKQLEPAEPEPVQAEPEPVAVEPVVQAAPEPVKVEPVAVEPVVQTAVEPEPEPVTVEPVTTKANPGLDLLNGILSSDNKAKPVRKLSNGNVNIDVTSEAGVEKNGETLELTADEVMNILNSSIVPTYGNKSKKGKK